MPRGYRYVILAAFGWLSLTGANPPQELRPSGNATQEASDADGVTSSVYAAYPDKNADSCYETANHDSADLCAQWRAAIAAEKAANAGSLGNWIAGAGAFLSFISILFVVIALRQTNKANRISGAEFTKAREEAAALARDTASSLAQARRSADAANEALGLAKEAHALELRPWIAFERLEVDLVFNSDQPQLPPNSMKISARFMNVGRGLAHAVTIQFAIKSVELTDTDVSKMPDFGKPLTVEGFLAPSLFIRARYITVRPDVFQAVIEGKCNLMVRYCVKYRTRAGDVDGVETSGYKIAYFSAYDKDGVPQIGCRSVGTEERMT